MLRLLLCLATLALLPVAAACGTSQEGAQPAPPDSSGSGMGQSGSGGQFGGASSNLPTSCAGAAGQVYLELPSTEKLSGLTVFAFRPAAVTETGAPAGKPVADVLVDMRSRVPGGEESPFPVMYRICTPTGAVVVVAAVDSNGDGEVLGEGDYVGHKAVEVKEGETAVADISLAHVLTRQEGKKGKGP